MIQSELTIKEQREILKDMLKQANKLRLHGDTFLGGHYVHLQERIEALLTITEINPEDIQTDR